MSKSRRSAVKKYHDRVAPRYDHSYDDDFWKWHDALTFDYLKPHLPRDLAGPVVDLGCGTGKWAARLIKSGYSVTCVDISHRMLDQARRKIEAQGGSDKATFVHADLCDLTALQAGRYALALALGEPIGCCQSPPRAMKQIRRILRDDGLLIATFDNRLAAIDFYLDRGDPAELSQFLRSGKTHWLTRDKDEQFEIVTYAPGDVVKLAESTGFEVVEMIGKTVLPMRHHRHLLDTPQKRRTWARIEKKLCRDHHALARAPHLEVTCRVAAH